MNLNHFENHASLQNKSELERTELIAFYLSENLQQAEFAVTDICSAFIDLGYAKPNTSRLKTNIQQSRRFINGSSKGKFRLAAKTRLHLVESYPDINSSEEVVSDSSLLPETLFESSRRQYLLKSVQQINAAYENNLFDACALMMRRLLEILLIHSFEQAGIEDSVKDPDGSYQNLKTLINKAKSRPEISLSSNVSKEMDEFRELGNLSAHRIMYNCRRDDIRTNRLKYRAVIEELLYLAGFVQRGS